MWGKVFYPLFECKKLWPIIIYKQNTKVYGGDESIPIPKSWQKIRNSESAAECDSDSSVEKWQLCLALSGQLPRLRIYFTHVTSSCGGKFTIYFPASRIWKAVAIASNLSPPLCWAAALRSRSISACFGQQQSRSISTGLRIQKSAALIYWVLSLYLFTTKQ